MADFLELVETIKAEEASAKAMFMNEGKQIISGSSPEYKAKLSEAVKLVAEVLNGGKFAAYKFQEAMSTSDFPILFGDIVDRQMLAAYNETPSTFRRWCYVNEVPDFRPVSRRRAFGADGVLKKVPELGEYQATKLDEEELTYRAEKFGAIFDVSFEAITNDDLGIIRDQPARFGVAARRTEEKFATETLMDDTFFSATNGNLFTNDLTVEGITAVLTALSGQLDDGGEPISVEQKAILMVPPALTIKAQNLLNAVEFVTTDGNTKTKTNNWFGSTIDLVTNSYLPIVGGADVNKTWYLLNTPQAGRAALEIGFLRGHASPELFMKAPNAITIGGGLASPMDGDFDHDAIMYKVRHIIGGTLLNPKYAAKSVATA